MHLIRHGQTLANEKRLYCGQTDLPLSENGAKEIAKLKAQGIYPEAEAFFTSGLLRTEQTLDIIFSGATGTTREAMPNIAEFAFGGFELKSYEQLKERQDYQAWITDTTGEVRCPGGESKNQFEKRVVLGFEYILEKVQKNEAESVFVVCHGGVIACIMERLFPSAQNFYEWQPKPGRGYTLIYASGRLHGYKKI
ncbi:MAG: histidine phosphatase family protein [Oscillospiraceae bacterium]|nr:histidine phosphatase family protein [Oscillospiraceae bacterium]